MLLLGHKQKSIFLYLFHFVKIEILLQKFISGRSTSNEHRELVMQTNFILFLRLNLKLKICLFDCVSETKLIQIENKEDFLTNLKLLASNMDDTLPIYCVSLAVS